MAFSDLVAATDRAVRAQLGGEAVLYAPLVGAAVEVTGVFDDEYYLTEGGEAGVETVAPAVFLQLADLPVHPDDDTPTLTIRGVTYQVQERRTAGMGSILLVLHRVV